MGDDKLLTLLPLNFFERNRGIVYLYEQFVGAGSLAGSEETGWGCWVK